MEYKTSPLKAIREKCLECCCGSSTEVKECTAQKCPIYPYRFGKNPFRQKREMTEEQRKAVADRLRAVRMSNLNDEEDDDEEDN